MIMIIPFEQVERHIMQFIHSGGGSLLLYVAFAV